MEHWKDRKCKECAFFRRGKTEDKCGYMKDLNVLPNESACMFFTKIRTRTDCEAYTENCKCKWLKYLVCEKENCNFYKKKGGLA